VLTLDAQDLALILPAELSQRIERNIKHPRLGYKYYEACEEDIYVSFTASGDGILFDSKT
jgi:hypothetical protein